MDAYKVLLEREEQILKSLLGIQQQFTEMKKDLQRLHNCRLPEDSIKVSKEHGSPKQPGHQP